MVALVVAACAASVAMPAPTPAVMVIVLDAGISAPAELPAGPATVTISNHRQAPRLLLFARLNAEVTSEQFMAALTTDRTGRTALALASILGGREVIPAVSKSVIFDLKPGGYVVLDLAAPPPHTAWFTVAASRTATPTVPAAAFTAELVDDQLVMPDHIKAGAQTWQIENMGARMNSLRVLRLNAGVRVEDALAMIMRGSAWPNPPPYQGMVVWTPMSAGERIWLTVDLPAGAYSVVTIMLDFAADPPRLRQEQGIMRPLLVTE